MCFQSPSVYFEEEPSSRSPKAEVQSNNNAVSYTSPECTPQLELHAVYKTFTVREKFRIMYK